MFSTNQIHMNSSFKQIFTPAPKLSHSGRERNASLKVFLNVVSHIGSPVSLRPCQTPNFFILSITLQILFPAGVLQPPLFSERQPMALNFGHIGTFMGHEVRSTCLESKNMNITEVILQPNQFIQPHKLLHGFDDTGRLYSPSGQKRVWWPSETSDQFRERTKCFVRQYTQEIFVGGTVDGRMTLSENIADNGGLVAAYEVKQEGKGDSGP